MIKVFQFESFKALGKQLTAPRVGDAGLDLFSTRNVEVSAGEKVVIPLGLAFEIPDNFVGLILDRSSMARRGFKVFGGVIDSSYRGEVVVELLNTSKTPYVISAGDKIAQMVVVPHLALDVVIVGDITELSPTARGANGFGSTGK